MKLVRYFFVGGTAAVVDFVIFAALIKLAGAPWFWSAVSSFTVATLVNYGLSIRFVFRRGARFASMHHEIGMVFLVSLIGLAINQTVLWACIIGGSIEPLVAKIAGTGVVFFWNYAARRYFVFNPVSAAVAPGGDSPGAGCELGSPHAEDRNVDMIAVRSSSDDPGKPK